MRIALNAGLIAQQMYIKLENSHGVVVQKGVTNQRAVLRLRIKLMRTAVEPSLFSAVDFRSLTDVLTKFGKFTPAMFTGAMIMFESVCSYLIGLILVVCGDCVLRFYKSELC